MIEEGRRERDKQTGRERMREGIWESFGDIDEKKMEEEKKQGQRSTYKSINT